MLGGLGNTDREPTYEIVGAALEEGQDNEIRLGKWKGDWRDGRLNYYPGLVDWCFCGWFLPQSLSFSYPCTSCPLE